MPGITLKCQTHQIEVLGVCMMEKCDKKSRLVCFKCVCDSHKHNKFIIPIEDLLNEDGEDFEMKNWPQSSSVQTIKKQLSKINNLTDESVIENCYDELIQEVRKAFGLVQAQTVKAYLESCEGKDKYVKELSELYEAAYSLETVKQLLESYGQKLINHEELQMNLSIFLENDSEEKEQKVKKLGQMLGDSYVKKYLQFDGEKYRQHKKQIKKQAAGIDKVFYLSYVKPFDMRIAETFSHQTVKQTDENTFYMKERSVIASTEPLKEAGLYVIEFHVSEYTGGCITLGVIPDAQIKTQQYWSSNPALCVNCMSLDAIYFTKKQGNFFGDKVKQSRTHQIISSICIETNSFEVTDQNRTGLFQTSPSYKLKPNLHFFIHNYTGQSCQITIDRIELLPNYSQTQKDIDDLFG